jgi:hypothetical protein
MRGRRLITMLAPGKLIQINARNGCGYQAPPSAEHAVVLLGTIARTVLRHMGWLRLFFTAASHRRRSSLTVPTIIENVKSPQEFARERRRVGQS